MSNKEKARAYHTAVSRYDKEAVFKMVDKDYIQHNPNVPTGRDPFIAFLPKLQQHGTRIENIRMIEDGPFIIMHHRWINAAPFGVDEAAAFHIIRFDEQGLIAEHWNVMTAIGDEDLLSGPTKITDLDKTKVNKAIIKQMFQSQSRTQHAIFGEGNFVLSISEGEVLEKKTAFYDLYMLKDSKVVSHWKVYQEIQLENLANNNGMFNFFD